MKFRLYHALFPSRQHPLSPLTLLKAERRCIRVMWPLWLAVNDQKAPDHKYALGAYRSLMATMLNTASCFNRAPYMHEASVKRLNKCTFRQSKHLLFVSLIHRCMLTLTHVASWCLWTSRAASPLSLAVQWSLVDFYGSCLHLMGWVLWGLSTSILRAGR